MVAIGGGLGTTSEMALALQWGKPVLAIHGAPDVPGRQVFDNEIALLAALLRQLS
jgi:predicted Rossmann-fold nucleotide-binding protein